MADPIYLDYNATTPVAPEVVEAMLPYLRERYGNPSSAHAYGHQAREAVERGRAQLAALLGCDPGEILFTGGGTESNNMVIKGAAEAHRSHIMSQHIITTAVEHPAVLQPCAYLAGHGYDITVLPVDGRGRVDPRDVERAITPGTILISVMLANNEVGTLQPVSEIAAIAHRYGVPVHTDAAQAVGKIPVDVRELGVDFLTVAGHKLYAPKGIGALYIRAGLDLPRLLHGAGHEGGRRAGTENVPYIVGLGCAADLARRDLPDSAAQAAALRDRLWEGLCSRAGDVRRNGDPDHSLPNTLSISFRQVQANALLAAIGDRVAASAGAACHADSVTVSPVLEAMAVPLDYAMGTLRLSVGRFTTADEVDAAVDSIAGAVATLQLST